MNIREMLARLLIFRDQDRVEAGGTISMRKSAQANREEARSYLKLARQGEPRDPESIFNSPLGRAAAWLGATIDAGQYVVYSALSWGEKEK